MLTVNGAVLPNSFEARGVMFIGSPGSGKSQGMMSMLDHIRGNCDRAIIYDPKPEFICKYFRPGDIVINPFDSRGIPWSPFAEIDESYHFSLLSHAMIPDQGDEPHFTNGPRAIVESVLERLYRMGHCSNGTLYHYLCVATIDEVKELVGDLPAGRFLGKGANPDALMSTITDEAKILKYMKGRQKDAPFTRNGYFSMRDWVRSKDTSSWIFFNVGGELRSELSRFVRTLYQIAISTTLSLSDDPYGKKTYFFIDEFTSLGKLEAIETLLKEGRSKRCSNSAWSSKFCYGRTLLWARAGPFYY